MTPHEKRPGVTSAVVATFDDDKALLVDPENARPSIPSAFVLGMSENIWFIRAKLFVPKRPSAGSQNFCAGRR